MRLPYTLNFRAKHNLNEQTNVQSKKNKLIFLLGENCGRLAVLTIK